MILIGIFMILFGASMIAADIPVLLLLFFVGVGLMILILALCSMLDYPRYFQSLESNGQMKWLLQDYAHATPCLNGNLRFGYSCLYAKGQGKLIPYTDIVRVYQYIHKTNFVEDRRELKYINREGKELSLCKLKVRGKSDADVRMIIGMLYQKNPGIQVGYHK